MLQLKKFLSGMYRWGSDISEQFDLGNAAARLLINAANVTTIGFLGKVNSFQIEFFRAIEPTT